MKRKNTSIAMWNRRWFSLEGRFLRWYSSKTAMNASGNSSFLHSQLTNERIIFSLSNRLGFVDLTLIDGIKPFESAVGLNTFIITCPENIYNLNEKNVLCLQAENASDYKKWMNILLLQAGMTHYYSI
jgi:hypothetical protein